jgi:hypothetical protein
MNAMFLVHPYKVGSNWVFDDSSRDLVREPFVFGIPEMIELFTDGVDNAQDGFDLLFSPRPFPQFQAKLVWESAEYEGNWYRLDGTERTGWLCPALLKYFDAAPAEIYCRVQATRAAMGRGA